jgi:hypothetical protein
MTRVLLLFPGALGDLVLLAPAVHALAENAAVEISVPRALAVLAARLLPGTLGPPLDGAAMSTLFTAGPSPEISAWIRDADLVHAWLGSGRPGVERGLRAAGAREVRCHAVVRADGPEHASTAYAADLGLAGPLRAPALHVADAAPVAWRVPWESRLVLHPGAGSPSKCWPSERFREVAERWTAGGGEVVVLLGPAEDGLRATWRATGHPLATDLDLFGTAALLASAPRYLGNDSGISHLAGALGLAGIVLFGPTRPERWRPLGGRLVPIGFDADAATIVPRLAGTRLDTPTPRH